MTSALGRPADRYPDEHDPRSTRRWLLIGGVVVVILGIALAWLGFTKFARKPVDAKIAGYELVSDATLTVQVQVTRADPDKPVSCIIYAKDREGAEVGRREFYVPPSNQPVVVVDSEVRTTRPGAVGDVYGCGTSVPAYLDRS